MKIYKPQTKSFHPTQKVYIHDMKIGPSLSTFQLV